MNRPNLNTLAHDDCCSPKLATALLGDEDLLMNLRRWTCPECGTEWAGELHKLDHGAGTLHWTPQFHFLLFKPAHA